MRSSVSKTLSGFIATLNGGSRLEPALRNLRKVVDELVVGVDDKTTDQSRVIAEKFADKTIDLKHAGFVEAYYQQLINACSGDWLINLDDDERLAGDWRPEVVQKLMNFSVDHHSVAIPRRWLTADKQQFISSHPWFPDLQIRMFRNDPERIKIKAEIHSNIDVDGEVIVLNRQFIDHHIFHFENLEQRKKKVEKYIALKGEQGSFYYFYLPEMVDHQTRILEPRGLITG